MGWVGRRVVVLADCLTWHDDLFLFSKMEAPVLLFSHRMESQQTATVQNLNGWMSLFLLFISCFKPASAGQSHRRVFVCKRSWAWALLPMRRSCTRLPRSGFARCTAYRWAPRCTSWSCWYLGWTWLWTDWWPAHRDSWKHSHLMLQVKLQRLTYFMSTIKWFTSYFYHQLKLKWRSLGNLIINGRNLWFW